MRILCLKPKEMNCYEKKREVNSTGLGGVERGDKEVPVFHLWSDVRTGIIQWHGNHEEEQVGESGGRRRDEAIKATTIMWCLMSFFQKTLVKALLKGS